MSKKHEIAEGPTSQAPSVFASEIDGFTARSRLSPREAEIVLSLIRNITNSEEIARTLGISTHTVNNHLKSIFEKTATKSKTEVLSQFLRYAADRLQGRGLFVRRPRILVVADDELIRTYVVNGLKARGVRAYGLEEAEPAVAMIGKLRIDAVVCDGNMKSARGLELLSEVRRTFRYWPHFFLLTGQERCSIEECMDKGATGFLAKPIDIDLLFRLTMSHVVESPEERYELLNLRGAEPVILEDPITPAEGAMGFGGAFVALAAKRKRLAQLQVGSLVDLCIAPSQPTVSIQARGQVVWKRPPESSALCPGIGVRFIDMSDTDRENFETWLYKVEPSSFIPLSL